MPAFHLLTGEYPPHAGGVGDYTQLVATALAARGREVHVWCPDPAAVSLDGLVHLHHLPDRFGSASRRAIEEGLAAAPGPVLLQYVPNALGARGANVRFCFWLRRLGRRADVRVMFHEPYFYFGWAHPSRNALALAQRVMAALLLRAGAVAYLSTSTWRRYLEPWAPSGLRTNVLPIPATIDQDAPSGDVARWRASFSGADGPAALVGHFGTYGDHVARELRAVVPMILQARRDVRIVCLGRGSEAFVETLPMACRGRVLGTGALSRQDLAAALRACDVAVQPYPDGVTTRRTSVMAALANGVPTVTVSGSLTEPLWSESRAVAMAPAGDAAALAAVLVRVLQDATGRSGLAARGRELYAGAFALERTIDALLDAAPEAVGA